MLTLTFAADAYVKVMRSLSPVTTTTSAPLPSDPGPDLKPDPALLLDLAIFTCTFISSSYLGSAEYDLRTKFLIRVGDEMESRRNYLFR